MRQICFLLCTCFVLGLVPASPQTSGLSAPQLFQQGMNALMGSNVSRNDQNAFDYFRRSAELGYAPAEVVLGYFYETGNATAIEPGQALDWYKKASAQDDPLAQWLVGRLIYKGDVAPRDLNEAEAWLQKSAAHDNPFAEQLLGMVRLERQDYSSAAAWFRKAAEQGLPQAQAQLGLLLKDGRGVNQDKFEGYVWLLISSDAGNRSVATAMQSLEADLGSNRIERAKTEARAREGIATRSVVANGCTGWPGEFSAIPAPPPPDLQRFCR